MKKGWFTMIETVIVLAIVSFLLGMTMYLWSQRINKLNDMNTKQNFVSKYQELYMNSITSSYFSWKKYDRINVDIDSKWFFLSIDSWFNYSLIDLSDFYFTGISADSKVVNWFKVKLYPYQIKCDLSYSWSSNSVIVESVNFVLKQKITNTSRCFKISNYNCKIIETSCG